MLFEIQNNINGCLKDNFSIQNLINLYLYLTLSQIPLSNHLTND